MVYRILKDIQQMLSDKKSPNTAEQSILEGVRQVIPMLRNDEDSELLRQNEVFVRICPATKAPVLACYEGDNMCSCLHNDSVEEDAVDIKQWLASSGHICTGSQRLLETVADIAYNAGADRICEGNDSQAVIESIIEWAREFEQKNVTNDWREDDYILAVNEFYREKAIEFKQQNY